MQRPNDAQGCPISSSRQGASIAMRKDSDLTITFELAQYDVRAESPDRFVVLYVFGQHVLYAGNESEKIKCVDLIKLPW